MDFLLTNKDQQKYTHRSGGPAGTPLFWQGAVRWCLTFQRRGITQMLCLRRRTFVRERLLKANASSCRLRINLGNNNDKIGWDFSDIL